MDVIKESSKWDKETEHTLMDTRSRIATSRTDSTLRMIDSRGGRGKGKKLGSIGRKT